MKKKKIVPVSYQKEENSTGELSQRKKYHQNRKQIKK